MCVFLGVSVYIYLYLYVSVWSVGSSDVLTTMEVSSIPLGDHRSPARLPGADRSPCLILQVRFETITGWTMTLDEVSWPF